jgi:hypothetical protein
MMNPVAINKESQNRLGCKGPYYHEPEERLPRKNKNAFFFFNYMNLDNVRNENPNMKNKDLLLVLSKKWGILSEKEKNKYVEMAAKDKERFKRDMQNLGKDESTGLKKKQPEKEESKFFNNKFILYVENKKAKPDKRQFIISSSNDEKSDSDLD